MSDHAYYTDYGVLSVPAGFRDRSTNVLEWTTPEGDAIALVIQRHELPRSGPDEEEAPTAADLARFVEGATKGYPGELASFRLERDEVATGEWSLPIHRKTFRWQKEQDVLYHHQAFVLAEGRVVVLTGAAKARHRDAVDALLDGALTSFRLRSG